MAFVYLVRCVDGSLYCGSTEQLDARISAHNDGSGGAYTRRHRPVTLVFSEEHATFQSAAKRERQIKGWSAAKKEALIAGDVDTLKLRSISRASPRFRR